MEAIARGLGLSRVAATVLAARGVVTPEAARAFLDPDLRTLDDGRGLQAIDPAAERIVRAIREREPTLVFGDYDVDGAAGGTLLYRFLKTAGANASLRLPHRMDDGYGLKAAHVREAAGAGCRLIVTVDNGIRALEAATEARALGVDLIVTDHHEPGPELPPCVVVHPGKGSEFRHLVGTSVAWKLAWRTARALAPDPRGGRVSPAFRAFLVDALALVALATVADGVPLLGENRLLVAFGLKVLRTTRHEGLRALLSVAGIPARAGEGAGASRGGAPGRGAPDTHDIAFRLAPRLNAAGRLASADLAAGLLLAEAPDEALRLATEIDGLNERRRAVQAEVYEGARRLAESDPGPAYVLADPGWHPGVIGIVAGKLAEELARPVILLSPRGERARGSGRSVEGISLVEVLDECHDCLIGHGGHAQACGLDVETARIPELRERVRRSVEARAGRGAGSAGAVAIDAVCSLDEVDRCLVDEIGRLAPFGAGHEPPVLGARDLVVPGPARIFGRDGAHAEFWVRGPGVDDLIASRAGRGEPGQAPPVRRVVAFGAAGRVAEIDRLGRRQTSSRLALAFRPRLDRGGGRDGPSICLEAVDWKVSSRVGQGSGSPVHAADPVVTNLVNAPSRG